MGWTNFFLMTTAAAMPGLMLLWWLTRRSTVGALRDHPSPGTAPG
jgi:hypothetical protein